MISEDAVDRYTIFENGEPAASTNDLEEARQIALHIYGKGYADDVYIWDNEKDEQIDI